MDSSLTGSSELGQAQGTSSIGSSVDDSTQPVAPLVPKLAVSGIQSGLLQSERTLADFMAAFFTPHEAILKAQQVYEPVLAMIQFVDTHGDCPSLVVLEPEKDQEAGDLYPVRQALLRVTPGRLGRPPAPRPALDVSPMCALR